MQIRGNCKGARHLDVHQVRPSLLPRSWADPSTPSAGYDKRSISRGSKNAGRLSRRLRSWNGRFNAESVSAAVPGVQRDPGPDHEGSSQADRAVRERLAASGRPCVIENVEGTPLIDPVLLCGAFFGLKLYEHRLFESSVPIEAPVHPVHTARTTKMGPVYEA